VLLLPQVSIIAEVRQLNKRLREVNGQLGVAGGWALQPSPAQPRPCHARALQR
jgi:hypothetical protein